MTGLPPEGEREPWQCATCGTVNPWMNDTCRDCGAAKAKQAAAVEGEDLRDNGIDVEHTPPAGEHIPSVEAGAPAIPVRRRIAIRWVFGGAAVFLLSYAIMQLALMGVIMADDNPDLAPLQYEIDRTLGRERVGPHTPVDQLDDRQKARVVEALRNNPLFIVGVFAMLLLPPLFGGLVVGRFSGVLREAALACGAGAFIGGTFIEGDWRIGLVSLGIMAPLGLAAGVLGRYLRSRRREAASRGGR